MKTVTFAFGAFAAVLALGGCSTTPPRNGTTYDKIAAELKDAGENRNAREQQQVVLQSLLPPLAIELPKPEALDAGQRFDLVVTNAPAPQVLNAMVAGTRYSMVVHPDIKAPMSLNLKDVTIPEVLNSVREIYGYEYKVDGTRIFVLPPTLQTRMFKIDYLTSLRRGSTDLRVSSNAVSTTGTTGTPVAQGGVGGVGGVGGIVPEPGVGPTGQQLGLTLGQSTQVGTTDANDFWRELRKTLAALIGCGIGERLAKDGQSTRTLDRDEITCQGGRRLIVSPQSGMVLAHVMPDELKSIAEYLHASQNSLDKQVLIEAKILEVTLKDGYEAGINWSRFFTRSSGTAGIGMMTPGTQLGSSASGVILQGGTPATGQQMTPLTAGVTTTSTTATGTTTATLGLDSLGGVGQVMAAGVGAAGSLFGVAVQGANFAALLTFLESQGVVHTLSSPRIATVNNQKAVLKIGSDALFVTKIESGSSTSTAVVGTTAAPSIPTFNVQSFFSGIALDVTPHIGDDDNIVLHVRPSVSNVTQNLSTFNLGILGTFTIPLVSNQISETDSVIRAKDGQIVAIGGLMRQAQSETRDQVPGVGNIPFLGAAFRSTVQASEKRELVILLKTTVVQNDQTWARNILDAGGRVQTLDRGFSWGGRSEVFGTQAEEHKQ
jgi:MSHA biogenesis protein MshL